MDTDKIESASIKGPEKPGENFLIVVNDVGFTASTLTGAISQTLTFLNEPTTKENIAEFIEVVTRGLPVEGKALATPSEASLTPGETLAKAGEEPAKSVKKRKAKAEKKQKTLTFVGKLFTDREGNDVYEVISETPPTEWQFTLRDLRNSDIAKDITLNLREFKELIPLVPQRSRKKEGK